MWDETLDRGLEMFIRLMGTTAAWIIRFPNPLLYFLLVLLCIVLPFFAVFLVISFICWSWSAGDTDDGYY